MKKDPPGLRFSVDLPGFFRLRTPLSNFPAWCARREAHKVCSGQVTTSPPTGTDQPADDVLQVIGIKQLEQDGSALVPTGQDLANGSGGRARTDVGTLEPEQLAEAGTQIGTQSLRRDPKLAQVIEAWPRLSPALQAAVLAIVACPER